MHFRDQTPLTGCPVMKSGQDRQAHQLHRVIYRDSFHIAGDMFNFPGKLQGLAIWDETPQQPFHVAKITNQSNVKGALQEC